VATVTPAESQAVLSVNVPYHSSFAFATYQVRVQIKSLGSAGAARILVALNIMKDPAFAPFVVTRHSNGFSVLLGIGMQTLI